MHMTVQSNPRKISKRGNSDHVSIPKDVLDAAGLDRGDRVVWLVDDGEVSLQPVQWEVATDE